MSRLPGDLQPYKRTANFTEASVPAALLADHSTKDGVWGLIRVEEGELHYHVTDQRRDATSTRLTPAIGPGVVEPTILHRIEPAGLVRFHIEFLRPAPR